MIRSVIVILGLVACGSQGELQTPNPPPQWYIPEDTPKENAQAKPTASDSAGDAPASGDSAAKTEDSANTPKKNADGTDKKDASGETQ